MRYSLSLTAGFEPIFWYLTFWGREKYDDISSNAHEALLNTIFSLNNIHLPKKQIFTSIIGHMVSVLRFLLIIGLLWVLIQSCSLSGPTKSIASHRWFQTEVVPRQTGKLSSQIPGMWKNHTRKTRHVLIFRLEIYSWMYLTNSL